MPNRQLLQNIVDNLANLHDQLNDENPRKSKIILLLDKLNLFIDQSLDLQPEDQLSPQITHPSTPSIETIEIEVNESSSSAVVHTSDAKEQEKIVDHLKHDLRLLLADPLDALVKYQDDSLIDISYESLDLLADLGLLNQEDPISYCEISEENRVVLSNGYQYDVLMLLESHKIRNYRGTELGELHERRYLLNPVDNMPFSLEDTIRIVKKAQALPAAEQHLNILLGNLCSYERIALFELVYLGVINVQEFNALSDLNKPAAHWHKVKSFLMHHPEIKVFILSDFKNNPSLNNQKIKMKKILFVNGEISGSQFDLTHIDIRIKINTQPEFANVSKLITIYPLLLQDFIKNPHNITYFCNKVVEFSFMIEGILKLSDEFKIPRRTIIEALPHNDAIYVSLKLLKLEEFNRLNELNFNDAESLISSTQEELDKLAAYFNSIETFSNIYRCVIFFTADTKICLNDKERVDRFVAEWNRADHESKAHSLIFLEENLRDALSYVLMYGDKIIHIANQFCNKGVGRWFNEKIITVNDIVEFGDELVAIIKQDKQEKLFRLIKAGYFTIRQVLQKGYSIIETDSLLNNNIIVYLRRHNLVSDVDLVKHKEVILQYEGLIKKSAISILEKRVSVDEVIQYGEKIENLSLMRDPDISELMYGFIILRSDLFNYGESIRQAIPLFKHRVIIPLIWKNRTNVIKLILSLDNSLNISLLNAIENTWIAQCLEKGIFNLEFLIQNIDKLQEYAKILSGLMLTLSVDNMGVIAEVISNANFLNLPQYELITVELIKEICRPPRKYRNTAAVFDIESDDHYEHLNASIFFDIFKLYDNPLLLESIHNGEINTLELLRWIADSTVNGIITSPFYSWSKEQCLDYLQEALQDEEVAELLHIKKITLKDILRFNIKLHKGLLNHPFIRNNPEVTVAEIYKMTSEQRAEVVSLLANPLVNSLFLNNQLNSLQLIQKAVYRRFIRELIAAHNQPLHLLFQENILSVSMVFHVASGMVIPVDFNALLNSYLHLSNLIICIQEYAIPAASGPSDFALPALAKMSLAQLAKAAYKDERRPSETSKNLDLLFSSLKRLDDIVNKISHVNDAYQGSSSFQLAIIQQSKKIFEEVYQNCTDSPENIPQHLDAFIDQVQSMKKAVEDDYLSHSFWGRRGFSRCALAEEYEKSLAASFK